MDPALSRWRADTPAASAGLVHLNNAGASLMPASVLDAVQEHLLREAAHGGYEAAEAAEPEVARVYEDVARLLGAEARNVAIVENATVAFAQALSAFDFAPGDVILTTRNDYASNQLMYLSLAERRGVEVVCAEEAAEGGVDPESVRELVARRRPAVVAVTWVPTNSGLVQPVAEVGRICREADVPFIVDACQAVGQLPVDVASLGCDFLAGTARKFLRGPRGIGFLHVSDRMLDQGRAPLFVDMRGADWTDPDRFRLAPTARRFENWEFPYALVLGLGEAARYALEVGVEEGGGRARMLAERARERLADIGRVLDRGTERCAIVTAAFPGHDAGDLVAELREWGINTSALRRVSAVLDMDDKGVETALRISPHYFNTEHDVDTAVSALAGLVGA